MFNKCLTRELIEAGHNISESGFPKDEETGCKGCNDPTCCSLTGPECGCGAKDCVDREKRRDHEV